MFQSTIPGGGGGITTHITYMFQSTIPGGGGGLAKAVFFKGIDIDIKESINYLTTQK